MDTETRISKLENEMSSVQVALATLRQDSVNRSEYESINAQLAYLRTHMASQASLDALRDRVTANITEFREHVTGEITGLREQVAGEITGLRDRLTGDMTVLRELVTSDITGLRDRVEGDVTALRDRSQADISSVNAKLAVLAATSATKEDVMKAREDFMKAVNALTWRMYGFGIVLVGAAYIIGRV